MIATGDLTDCGLAEEYEVLRDILEPLSMPVYLVPGNHDRRAELFAEFGPDGYLRNDDGFLHYVIEGHDVRLIGLDSVVPGHGHGEMCAARLAWLEGKLGQERERPTMIFMHHPPFGTGLADMDRINCRNGASMAAVLRRFGQYRARGVRPSSSPHHRALGRHHRLGGAQHGPPGDARPRGRRRTVELHHGAAGQPICTSSRRTPAW